MCGSVKQERIPWLSSSGRFTQRFVNVVGEQCRGTSIKHVAKMNQLSWGQTRRLEMEYMRKLVAKHPPPKRLRAIGIDEISIKKGQSYAIVVADLDHRRPIWMSEKLGRSEEDMDVFFENMGPKRCKNIRLAVMDMWKPFRNSLNKNAPKAEIIFDKFHVIGHLSKALDIVRRHEYGKASEKDRRFIKGQRFTLLSRKANLDLNGRRSLRLLLKANKRLNKAYLLKESFGQLWEYRDPDSCLKFFKNWKAQLRWSRIKPFHKFAAMVERHWDGIASYCGPGHKVSLGFMEGLNNKIRVIQRTAYGIKDMEYLRLKVITF